MSRNATSAPAARSAQPRQGGNVPERPGPPRIQTTADGESLARARIGAVSGAHGPSGWKILQRTAAPRSSQPSQKQVLVRRVGPTRDVQGQQGQTQRGPSSYQARTQGRNQGQGLRPNQASAANPTNKSTDRRVRRLAQRTATATAENDDPDSLAAQDLPTQVENYVNTIVDPPVNPTTELLYTPGKDLSTAELRKDWPNTPLSGEGLVESVQQRIEWLAKRLPHGYQTHRQLAMHYTKGHLTRFESDEERDAVLSVARELTQNWADRDTEKNASGTLVEPENMEFEDLVSRTEERKGLAETWVMGKYPDVKKQKMPFLDQIERNLNNNATVTLGKKDSFMQTVQRVLAAGQQSRQQDGGQGQKRARQEVRS